MIFAELILIYFQKMQINENDSPHFFFDSKLIPYDSNNILDEIPLSDGSLIDVILGSLTIGSY